MSGATGALYEPMIERDFDAFPAAARAFADEHSPEDLWVAIARFAVLAYAPSQHSKRAFIACRAAHEVRGEVGERWLDLVIECGRYAAASRQPWSEPPLIEPPEIDASQARGAGELRDAIAAADRERAERWLAASLGDDRLIDDLRAVARGDALLVADAAAALAPHLGEKGRYALFRLPILEMLGGGEEAEESDAPDAPLESLIARAVAERGAVDAVRAVFLRAARNPVSPKNITTPRVALEPVALQPYELARDYAQTLIAHAVARRLPESAGVAAFLAAVHDNLQYGESFAEWSFA